MFAVQNDSKIKMSLISSLTVKNSFDFQKISIAGEYIRKILLEYI
jgi:hypothetical protein